MAKKPNITTIASGYYSRQALNNNFENLRDKFDNTLSLDGATPNAMGADFDVNGHNILNAGQIDTDTLYINGVEARSASDLDFETTYLVASYTGDNTTVDYALTANPQTKNNVSIYVDGVYQNKDTFSLSGTTVTFLTAPSLNTDIEIVYPTNTSTLNGSNATSIVYNQDGTGAQDRTLTDKLQESVTIQDFGVTPQNSPFGKTGMRLVSGEKRDAHYGWGSIVEIEGNPVKWVTIYRKGTEHGVEDGTEIRAADSYDFGASWVNNRLVQTDATTDSRPDKIAKMANGRIGFFCNRASSGSTNKFPLFIYSDDGGVTWTKDEIPTSSTTYTFAAVGGIIDFPTSQGGNDTTGFVTFGYIDATGVDAFTTTDNGDTWSTVSNVSGSAIVSENVIVRLGTTDRWLIYARDNPTLSVFATTNLLSWGTAQSAGVDSLSTPPAGFYDAETDKVFYIATARSGKEVDGYTNNLLYVSEDAETLWAADGVFTNEYKALLTTPNWTTGYFYTFDSRLGLGAVFTAGENVDNGAPPSSVWMVGNFETTGADVGMFVDKYTRNLKDVAYVGIKAVDNLTDTYPFSIQNEAESVINYIGAYAASYNLGGATYNIAWNNGDHKETFSSSMTNVEYDFNNTGTTKFNGNNLLVGSSTNNKINTDSAVLHLRLTGSTSPSIRSASIGTSSSRKHVIFHHDAGADITVAPEVGSISTTTTATAFNTSSDETLKDFTGDLSAERAIDVIKADPVREFTWKSNGSSAVGWGAQTSYAVSNDLATAGGWFLLDEESGETVEVEENTEGAVYVPWGVDQSKRTPYLWAAVSYLVDKLAEAEARIEALENN